MQLSILYCFVRDIKLCPLLSLGENIKISTLVSAENDSVRDLLREIRDSMQVRIERIDEQRYKDEKEEEMKNDWMLAAAVLDRICAFAFAIILVAGTVVFITLITTHRA